MSTIRRLIERFGDRVSALVYAIQRCDRFCDPVQTYADELTARLVSRSDRYRSSIEAAKRDLQHQGARLDQQQSREATKLEKDIANALVQLEINEKRLSQIRDEASPELTQTRELLNRWKRAVGRPPYFEEFEALFKHKSLSPSQQHPDLSEDDPKIDQQVNPQTFMSRRLRNVRNILLFIFAAFPVAAVPADVFFTYPSFDFLLNDHPKSALAAAALFTVALAVLGEAIGVFYLRTFRHSLDASTGGEFLRHQFHWWSSLLLLALSVGAIYSADVGATLRALVPKVNEYNAKKVNIAEEENSLPRATIFGKDPHAERRQKLFDERNKLEEDGAKLVKDYQPFWESIDGQVAFAIYMILVFSVAVRRIISQDPIFEYGLHALHHRELARSFMRDMLKAAQAVNRATDDLNSLEKKLSILQLVPADHSDEIKKQVILINRIEEKIGKLEGALRRLAGGDNQIWIRSRARRFGKYYLLFRLGLPEHARKIITRHLAGAPVTRTDTYLHQEAA